MDLDLSLGDRTMQTAVYLKMDAHNQLLLSEGVCCQLNILTYHKDVERWREGRKKTMRGTGKESPGTDEVNVPMVSQPHAVSEVGSMLQCCGQSPTDPPHLEEGSCVCRV